MTAQLSEVSKLAEQLNAETATVNHQIKEVNEALEAMQIGFEVWLTADFLDTGEYRTPDHEDDYLGADGEETEIAIPGDTVLRSFIAEQLGYALAEDKWQLVTRTVTCEEYLNMHGNTCDRLLNPSGTVPLLKGTRMMRIEALKLLPQLTDKIKDKIQDSLKTISDAKSSAKKL